MIPKGMRDKEILLTIRKQPNSGIKQPSEVYSTYLQAMYAAKTLSPVNHITQ